jgi:biotin operon repressor
MAKRISTEVERRLLEAYTQTSLAGEELAAKFGVGSTTLYRVLRRNGVPIDPKKSRLIGPQKRFKFSPKQEALIAKLYASGVKPSVLSHRFQCSPWTVREVVRRRGATLLRRGGQLRPWSASDVSDIVRRYHGGESQDAIAQSLGTSQTTVCHILATAGVSTGLARRERHGNWGGGRIRMAGMYVGVLVDFDDPMSEMRTTAGYVMEHRLVMARHLGRPLTQSETVHHINGKRTDNRIENLELRVGKHGRGVVMVCADCGSRNIRSCEISSA